MPLQDYYNTGANTQDAIYDVNWGAQTFTANQGYTLSSVKLKLYRVGTPGTITIRIRATTAGLPSGGDLAIGTTDGDTLTTDEAGEWREITLVSPYELTSGIKYAIVVDVAGGASGNRGNWKKDSSAPTYTNGNNCYSVNSGVDWAGYTASDNMFETYGESGGGGVMTPNYYTRLLAGNS